MYKRKSLILRILSFLPAVFMMYIIFGFSGDTAEESSSLSEVLTEKTVIILEQLVPDLIPTGEEKIAFMDVVHTLIRKLAHMTEYALLAMTLIFALWVNRIKEKKQLLLTLLICFLYACTDEIHQLFVPGRSGKFLDVCIDMAGVGIIILLKRLCDTWRRRCSMNHTNSGKL